MPYTFKFNSCCTIFKDIHLIDINNSFNRSTIKRSNKSFFEEQKEEKQRELKQNIKRVIQWSFKIIISIIVFVFFTIFNNSLFSETEKIFGNTLF